MINENAFRAPFSSIKPSPGVAAGFVGSGAGRGLLGVVSQVSSGLMLFTTALLATDINMAVANMICAEAVDIRRPFNFHGPLTRLGPYQPQRGFIIIAFYLRIRR
jgi:hypothetical protein